MAKYGQVAAARRRQQLRDEFFEGEPAYLGPQEGSGFFCAPRSLPLVLNLLRLRTISGQKDPSAVYLELLSRHMGEGLVEMTLEDEHAFAAGYTGTRAVRSWRDRMRILEDCGFIRGMKKGSRYWYVLLRHPAVALDELRASGRVPDEWWDAYRARRIETKEPDLESVRAREVEGQ
jgi:hypothetical protein